MKNNEPIGDLPDQISDIASGKIFDVPPDYFKNLQEQLFDNKGELKILEQRTSAIHTLRPWLVAASIALVAYTGWFMLSRDHLQMEDLQDKTTLSEYIQMEIMEYDLETLSRGLNESDLYPISDARISLYEEYIEENIDEYDGIIY